MAAKRASSNTGSAVPAELVDDAYCPFFQHAIEVVGRRWTGSILKVLSHGELGFSAIREAVPGLSDRLLDTRLRELEGEDIVERCSPDDSLYQLTAKGQGLSPVFDAIETWATSFNDCAPNLLPGRIQ